MHKTSTAECNRHLHFCSKSLQGLTFLPLGTHTAAQADVQGSLSPLRPSMILTSGETRCYPAYLTWSDRCALNMLNFIQNNQIVGREEAFLITVNQPGQWETLLHFLPLPVEKGFKQGSATAQVSALSTELWQPALRCLAPWEERLRIHTPYEHLLLASSGSLQTSVLAFVHPFLCCLSPSHVFIV